MLGFVTDNLSSPLVGTMVAGAKKWIRERGWTLFFGQAGPLIAGSWIRVLDDRRVPAGVKAVCAY